MPIAIVLRTSGTENIFRDTLVGALGSKNADEALLCSGFFQENFKGSVYQASAEKKLGRACAKSKVKLTSVGIHNNTWLPSYRNFRDNMLSHGADITCYYRSRMHWHAKVFIASSNCTPSLGIIGSSNLTRNAFSIGNDFNNECDVFLWTRNGPFAGIAEATAERLNEQIVVRAPYIKRQNGGRSLPDLLDQIRSKVLGQDLRELI